MTRARPLRPTGIRLPIVTAIASRILFRRGFAAFTIVLCGSIDCAGAAAASSTQVDFGDISHKGLKDLGPASTGLKLSLELGMIANQQGIANAVKAGSNPSSSSYGDYLSLSTLHPCPTNAPSDVNATP
jgi:hypothetical protein